MKTIKLALYLATIILISACAGQSELPNYTKPQLKKNARLIYPQSALDNSITGELNLLLTIDENGQVKNIRIRTSTGSEVLDKAGIEYAGQLEFYPAIVDGQPVKVVQGKKILFKLENIEYSAEGFIQEARDIKESFSCADDFYDTQALERLINLYDSATIAIHDAGCLSNAIYEIINPTLQKEWGDHMDNFPITFLLLHDLVQLYPKCIEVDRMKEKLVTYALADLKFLDSYYSDDFTKEADKKYNLKVLIKTIKTSYPDLLKSSLQKIIERHDNPEVPS